MKLSVWIIASLALTLFALEGRAAASAEKEARDPFAAIGTEGSEKGPSDALGHSDPSLTPEAPDSSIGKKLGRGFVNVFTFWGEVPRHISLERQRSGAGFFRGLGPGLQQTYMRFMVGFYEIISFPLPAPPDYRPMLYPVYVFEPSAWEADVEEYEEVAPEDGESETTEDGDEAS